MADDINQDLEVEEAATPVRASSSTVNTVIQTKTAANPLCINVGDKILVLGQSQCGKTTLIERLVHENYSKFDVIWAFCGTVAVSSNYLWNEPFLIQLDAKTQLGEDTHLMQIKKIIRLQQMVAEKYHQARQKKPTMLLIFDDCLSMNFYNDGSFWGEWMSSLRHYAITLLFSVQTLHQTIGPNVRSQMDKVYIYRNRSSPELMMQTIPCLRWQGKTLTGKAAYDIISEQVAEPYFCMFFDNLAGHQGSRYKAVPTKPFTISYGARAMRHM